MPDIRMPDGQVVRFPDDMPKEQIKSIIQSKVAPETEASRSFRDQASGITQGFEKARGGGTGRSVDSFMRGAADLASFGLADEFSAGMGALTGIGGDFGDYDRNLNRQRIEQEIRDRQDPISSNLGRVAGGVGTAILTAGMGPTAQLAPNAGTLARMGAAAKEGAAFGGAYGFGSGEGFTDRLAGGAGGAVAGGLIGGAIPAVVAGAKAVTKPVTDAIGARINPAKFAGRKVESRLAASNISPETAARKMDANPGSSLADVGGKSTRDLLRTTVNIPGPAKDRVTKQVTLRQFGQGDRLKQAVARTFADPDGYLAAKDELAKTAKQVAAPLYDRAYARPVHFSEGLEEILKTPAGQKALANAQTLAANEQQPFKQVFINIQGEAKRVPDTRGWDYIKRSLDDMIEGQKDSITGKMTNEGRILTNLKDRMLREVDAMNPDYRAARQAFGGIAQLDEAMEFGRKAFTMSPQAVRKELMRMGTSQKEAVRLGAAEALRKEIDGAGWTHNAVLKVFGNRQRLANLRALFDNDKQFAEFRKTIFQEARKRSTYEAVRGNSTTASQLADMMESGGNEGAEFIGRAATQGPVNATLQWLGSRMKMLGGMTPRVADEIAKRLMTTNPAQVRRLMTELQQIEASRIGSAQKSQLVQSLITKMLAQPTAGAISQN